MLKGSKERDKNSDVDVGIDGCARSDKKLCKEQQKGNPTLTLQGATKRNDWLCKEQRKCARSDKRESTLMLILICLAQRERVYLYDLVAAMSQKQSMDSTQRLMATTN